MSLDQRIRVVDPATVEQVESVTGLVERTVLRVGDARLLLVVVDDESAWHRRDGVLYGWVRGGGGHVQSRLGSDRELEPGDFVRVPADTAHRFVAGTVPLEILAVAAAGSATPSADPRVRVGRASTETVSATDGAEIAVVGSDELFPTVQSPHLIRESPFPEDDVLLLRVTAAGGAAAGWHHHGNNVYFGYAVDGPSETEYGPGGEQVARIELGECFHVPPGVVHRDTNPTDEAHTGIIWLCGGEPWVVNVDGPA
ncbi:cupin domain-containing protein [Haloarchaeobius sp. DFWS5]|uniref:cupin domain-containing protein n=1 Tax=Haloarchaeobius sp. DFWS5 TaxID=3446114 RepID=UPI003EBA0B6A